jgi:hypothetical protein
MTHEKRNNQILSLFLECKNTLETKGKDYAGLDDANYNFIFVGERLGINPKQVLLVYLLKHIDRIVNTIKLNPENPVPFGETLHESIKDAINYLAILDTLLP